MAPSNSQKVLVDRAKKKKARMADPVNLNDPSKPKLPERTEPERQASQKAFDERKKFEGEVPENQTPERRAEQEQTQDPEGFAKKQEAIGQINKTMSPQEQVELNLKKPDFLPGVLDGKTPQDIIGLAGVAGTEGQPTVKESLATGVKAAGILAAGAGVIAAGTSAAFLGNIARVLPSRVGVQAATNTASTARVGSKVFNSLFGGSLVTGAIKLSRTQDKTEATTNVTNSISNINSIIGGVEKGLYLDNPTLAVQLYNQELQNILRSEKTLHALKSSPFEKVKIFSAGAGAGLADIEAFRRLQGQYEQRLTIALGGAI